MPIWEENKRLANIANHKVDFRDLDSLNWAEALIFEDMRRDYGEPRMIAMAKVGRRLHIVVYVERIGDRRFISARRPTKERSPAMKSRLLIPTPGEEASACATAR
jgi:uncharacterized DUF497 family protein